MRELKFRRIYRWDHDVKNSYFDVKKGDFYVDFITLNEAHTVLDRTAVSPYLQYTGLKDKNGKEIYEGDIIEVGFGEHKGAFGKMIFEYGCFMLESRHGATFMDTYKSCLYGKIVGNIFENSELLE